METTHNTFSSRVAGAVKAELARRDHSGNDLAEVLDLGRNAVYARLRGERPFDAIELAKIADYLDITVDVLFASAALAGGAAA